MEKKELIVVKIGTNTISLDDKSGLDLSVISNIGSDIRELNSGQDELRTILVSSAAAVAGIEKNQNIENIEDHTSKMQVAAMVGNLSLFAEWRNATGYDIALDLPTHNDLTHDESWNNLCKSIAYCLQIGVMPGFNEGDARSSEELEEVIKSNGGEFFRFGDNDKLASMLSIKVGAFALGFANQRTSLAILTNTNGVLENVNRPDSVIRNMNLSDVNTILETGLDDSGSNNGGMTSKLESSRDAILSGVDVYIGNGRIKNGLLRLLAGEIGTRITR